MDMLGEGTPLLEASKIIILCNRHVRASIQGTGQGNK